MPITIRILRLFLFRYHYQRNFEMEVWTLIFPKSLIIQEYYSVLATCKPVTRLEICVSVTHASVWVGPSVMVGRCGGIPTPAPREGLPTHHPPPQVPSRQLMPPNFLCRHPPNLFNVKADYSGNFDRHSYDGGEEGNPTQTHVVNFTCRIHNDSLLFGK